MTLHRRYRDRDSKCMEAFEKKAKKNAHGGKLERKKKFEQKNSQPIGVLPPGRLGPPPVGGRSVPNGIMPPPRMVDMTLSGCLDSDSKGKK